MQVSVFHAEKERFSEITEHFCLLFSCFKVSDTDFPGGPDVKTLPFQCRGRWFNSCYGTKTPHAMWCCQKEEKNKNQNSVIAI